MRNFWKKALAGAVIGLAFGGLAAFSFVGVTRVVNRFFPAKASVTAKFEEKTESTAGAKNKDEEVKEKELDKDDNEKVESATLTMSVGDDENKAGGEVGMGVTELAKNNLPCVVSITNTSIQTLRDMWGNGVREYENVSRGSGIIIGQTDEELLIVTNGHVVNGADTITVGFVDNEMYEATSKGADTDMDLAVIGVKMSDLKSSTRDAIKVAVIGDSDKLEVGEQVVAIGNAIGYGQSVTTGIVSAIDRDVPDDDSEVHYIQTDAAINPGNSGGALINMKGEVVGINSAKIAATYVEGMGYAIPMKDANPTIEALMNRKTRDKVDEEKAGYLGITGVSVDSQTSSMYGIPEGIYLQEIIDNGPAEKAGLKKGDVIKKFDGVSVTSIADLRDKLDYYTAGEKVDIVFFRQDDGEYVEKTVTVTLDTKAAVGIKDDEVKDKSGSKPEDKKEDKQDKDKDQDKEKIDPEEYYNSLPDEIKEFFFGFGR